MKNLFGIIVSVIFIAGCNATAPVKYEANSVHLDLDEAQKNGMALYNAMLSGDATDEPTSREADLIEMASSELLCDGKYKAVSINEVDPDLESIYLVLQPPKESGIQVGRHLRFDFKVGTNDLDELTLSTKSCLLIPKSDEESVAAFVTHLLSPTPNEFHVYLSLLHGQPLYVSTELGLWKVENGTITKSDA